MGALKDFGQTSEIRVQNALNALRAGRGILVVDDEDRENEGDLIFAAGSMSEAQMAQMIQDCSGIICLCLSQEKVDALELPMMVSNNSSRYQTAFTVSIEAKLGVSTGVSATDRLTTIRAAINPSATKSDLVYPGHVFPIVAREGGVLTRRGHTESSVDLVAMAGLGEGAVLCELCNPDGSMKKFAELVEYAKAHQLPMLSVEDVVCVKKAMIKEAIPA
jgi:3,4-dihydroxy 2-butanone 4-phosphate synthase